MRYIHTLPSINAILKQYVVLPNTPTKLIFSISLTEIGHSLKKIIFLKINYP